ncbi:MAG: hypothetical protein ACI9BD_000441 [Candidatus Marinamargulisbacteria bacterium]|jgi:hypothetical protein
MRSSADVLSRSGHRPLQTRRPNEKIMGKPKRSCSEGEEGSPRVLKIHVSAKLNGASQCLSNKENVENPPLECEKICLFQTKLTRQYSDSELFRLIAPLGPHLALAHPSTHKNDHGKPVVTAASTRKLRARYVKGPVSSEDFQKLINGVSDGHKKKILAIEKTREKARVKASQKIKKTLGDKFKMGTISPVEQVALEAVCDPGEVSILHQILLTRETQVALKTLARNLQGKLLNGAISADEFLVLAELRPESAEVLSFALSKTSDAVAREVYNLGFSKESRRIALGTRSFMVSSKTLENLGVHIGISIMRVATGSRF